MQTRTVTGVAATSTDLASFKNWGRQIHDALSGFDGWTQTSDTGQVDWSTLSSAPTAPATVYEVWKMSDSLASASPVYVRFDFRPYSGSTTGINALVTLGTGSDGSGNITGNATSALACVVSSTNYATGYSWKFSAEPGRFTVMAFVGGVGTSSTFPFVLNIERSRNSSGVFTEDYTTVLCMYSSVSHCQSVFKPGGAVNTTQDNTYVPAIGFSPNSGAVGSYCFVSPVFPIVGRVDNPIVGLLSCKAADVLEGTTFGVTLYGENVTYWPSKSGGVSVNFGAAGNNNAVCIAWENT